jgi:molybdenum cofactor biosynthesis enzyme MoaA
MDLQTKTLSIFGKEYRVYSGACCSSVSPKRTLYVEFTKNCNAHCPFCSAHRGLGDLDPAILKECVGELVDAGAVDRVSITGGEPLIVGDSLRLGRLFDTLEQSGLDYYALTTNGRYLARNFVMLDTLSKLKYLNVSRHHYDDEENRRVFGDRNIPGIDEITGIFGLFGGKPLEFRLNCTLYPDADADFVNRYIQTAADAGISCILFRSDYFSRPDPALSDMFRNLLNGRNSHFSAMFNVL